MPSSPIKRNEIVTIDREFGRKVKPQLTKEFQNQKGNAGESTLALIRNYNAEAGHIRCEGRYANP